MRSLKDYIDSFDKHFNPDTVEGNKLVDSKSGFFLSYSIDFELNSEINLIAIFGFDQRVIQRWGCVGDKQSEKQFIAFYEAHKNKAHNIRIKRDQDAFEKAVNKLNW